jgi:hypothetical protein
MATTQREYNDTTPGPWYYSSGAVWADADERVGIARRVSDAPIPGYQRDNNMRLCAAAPEMYGMLQRINLYEPTCAVDHIAIGGDCYVCTARALLAKIDGGAA